MMVGCWGGWVEGRRLGRQHLGVKSSSGEVHAPGGVESPLPDQGTLPDASSFTTLLFVPSEEPEAILGGVAPAACTQSNQGSAGGTDGSSAWERRHRTWPRWGLPWGINTGPTPPGWGP